MPTTVIFRVVPDLLGLPLRDLVLNGSSMAMSYRKGESQSNEVAIDASLASFSVVE